ncbi:three component ABC system middle component [Sphingomonas sp. PvP018]|uniref:three component ABC system middle component n=1 Tax=Sphingomonas sp. PvP018 TaxID=2817852 RepID=UPI001FD9BC0C|nr:three component ABC system middle component [Sphingomonas sp. PvP018]
MRPDHEETVLRNPALVARALWHVANSYTRVKADQPPLLHHLALAGGMLLNRSTADRIGRMKFDSGMLKAIADRPEMVAGLQARVEEHLPYVLRAVQLGASTRLLVMEPGLRCRALGADLPREIRAMNGEARLVLAAGKRLGAWFAVDDLPVVAGRLGVAF